MFSTEPGAYENSQVFSGGNFWGCLSVGWIMGRERASDEMGGVTNGKLLAFGWVEVQLPFLTVHTGRRI